MKIKFIKFEQIIYVIVFGFNFIYSQSIDQIEDFIKNNGMPNSQVEKLKNMSGFETAKSNLEQLYDGSKEKKYENYGDKIEELEKIQNQMKAIMI